MERQTLPQRKSIRLKGYDYSATGAYVVTICTQDRACMFGTITAGVMQANDAGQIVQDAWAGLPARYANVELDAFVVMPNHVHGIIVLMDVPRPDAGGADGPCRGAIDCARDQGVMNHARTTGAGMMNHARTIGEIGAANRRAGAAGVPPLGEVVRAFKAVSARRIRQAMPGTAVWQRNFYEQVVRDDDSLNWVRAYVLANPVRWLTDRDNPNPIHGVERRTKHD